MIDEPLKLDFFTLGHDLKDCEININPKTSKSDDDGDSKDDPKAANPSTEGKEKIVFDMENSIVKDIVMLQEEEVTLTLPTCPDVADRSLVVMSSLRMASCPCIAILNA
ncbi:hypothetical protein ACH5RR_037153 [Cinchona calisaya]|uniref:Uncharacterized protein n=1 Tax=Cinchona calisaya TaxID=153742 RepID=A0ABD2Y8Z1_9GENT